MTREEARLTLQENFGYLSEEHPRIVEALKVALDVLGEPFLPSNLDEAAECTMPEEYGFIEIDIYGGSQAVYSREQMLAMYKAGAEWMAGQGVSTVAISSAEDGITEEGMKLIADYLGSLPDKTEVILQIRKK